MQSTIGARIRQLRGAKQLSVADFAKAAGVKPSAVYGLESDANKPSLETVAALRASFPGLNTEWLQFGAGQMFDRALTPAPRPEPAPEYTSGAATVAQAENILLRQHNEHLLSENSRLWDMLGKSPGSSDAAEPYPPHPVPVPQLRAQSRRGRIGFRFGRVC